MVTLPHPGVSIYIKGHTWCCKYRRNGADCRKSLKTADKLEAEGLAHWIYKVLQGQPYKLGDVPKTVKDMLQLKGDGQR